MSAADQAAIDEALFADTEGSLLTEGPGASTQELEKDLAMAGWRPPRPCRPTAGAPAAPSCPWKCAGEASGRPRGGWDALWEKIADHYRMTSLL